MSTIDVGVNASQKAVLIWQFIREFFAKEGLDLEFTLYSTTDQMVRALKSHEIDIAWHGPMGWVETVRATDGACVGIGARDGDVDYKSFLVTSPGSEIRDLADLIGRRVALGFEDAIDNSIMPLYYLKQSEIPMSQIKVVRPLGPRVRELDYQGEVAGVAAVRDGRADAAFVGYKYWQQTLSTGADGGSPLEIAWESPPRGHCVFAALDNADKAMLDSFTDRLFQMDYSDPEQRQVMDLEWVTKWVPPHMLYDELIAALDA